MEARAGGKQTLPLLGVKLEGEEEGGGERERNKHEEPLFMRYSAASLNLPPKFGAVMEKQMLH
jgi:hypothetical protein